VSIHRATSAFYASAAGEHHRYRSWEHCYTTFGEQGPRALPRIVTMLRCSWPSILPVGECTADPASCSSMPTRDFPQVSDPISAPSGSLA
jgi:hypothetical protein